jgi:hypothetical protein
VKQFSYQLVAVCSGTQFVFIGVEFDFFVYERDLELVVHVRLEKPRGEGCHPESMAKVEGTFNSYKTNASNIVKKFYGFFFAVVTLNVFSLFFVLRVDCNLFYALCLTPHRKSRQ